MAGDRGLAFVVISLISFSAFSIVGARRIPSQPKLGIIKNVPAPSDAQFLTKAAQHGAGAVLALELRADADVGAAPEVKADNLPTMRAHLLLFKDAASGLGVELAGLNNH